MGIVDNVENAVKKYMFGVGLKKGVTSLVKLIISYCTAKGISISVAIPGIGTLDTNSELALAAFINSGLTILRNWAKTKWPKKFAWL